MRPEVPWLARKASWRCLPAWPLAVRLARKDKLLSGNINLWSAITMERDMDKVRKDAAAKQKAADDKQAANAKHAADGKSPKVESPGCCGSDSSSKHMHNK
jgi:hypothetical protein